MSGAVEKGSKYDGYFTLLPTANPSYSLMYFVPLGLLGAYFAWRYYTTGFA